MYKTQIIIIVCILAIYGASAASYDFDDNDNRLDRADDSYGLKPFAKPLPDGYYVVEGGRLQVVSPPNRRQDPLPKGTRFTPLVKYKQTHAKRKKLFVPNFFG